MEIKYYGQKRFHRREINQLSAKKKKKKKFVIECRWKSFLDNSGKWGEWHNWNKYATEEDRLKAFQNLTRKADDWKQYRIPENDR